MFPVVSTAVYEIPGEVVKLYTGESRWKQAKGIHVYSLLAGVGGAPSVTHVDALMDLAKTIQYERTRSPMKVAGLFAGYGPLPADGLARNALYRLYHALELWDWFAEIGNTGPLDGIAADIRELASP